MIELIKPFDSFSYEKIPAPYDYSLAVSWAAHPDRADGADAVPPGYRDNQATAPVDVFYLHPTVFMGRNNWNAAVNENSGVEELVQFILAAQASVFNGSARIYAPNYRQATLYSFRDDRGNGNRALDTAYEDVLAAFDYFVKHLNKGRPFIIAGHSQGALHGQRLIMDRIDGTSLYDQFVAGYLFGYSVPRSRFSDQFRDVVPCAASRDTGCIVSWMTYGEGGRDDRSVPNHNGTEWVRENRDSAFCVNPVSWRYDEERTDTADHKGGAHIGYGKFFQTALSGKASGKDHITFTFVKEGLVAAQCSGGYLYISEPGKPFLPFAGTNYHMHDVSLFYLDIRENAAERVQAFIAGQ